LILRSWVKVDAWFKKSTKVRKNLFDEKRIPNRFYIYDSIFLFSYLFFWFLIFEINYLLDWKRFYFNLYNSWSKKILYFKREDVKAKTHNKIGLLGNQRKSSNIQVVAYLHRCRMVRCQVHWCKPMVPWWQETSWIGIP